MQEGQRSITFSRVIHLSHVVSPGMPQWPDDPPLAFDTVADLATHGYRVRRVVIGEHSATHVNAAASFEADGSSMERYPADALVRPAVVIDCRSTVARDADYRLTRRDVASWEQSHGRLPAGSFVLMLGGWAERWGDPRGYFNQGADGRMHFPGFSSAAVEMLIERREVGGIGIDTHGVDGGTDSTFAVNRRVLAGGRLVLENLANLEQLPPTGATAVIGILRLQGGTGSPAGVLALVP